MIAVVRGTDLAREVWSAEIRIDYGGVSIRLMGWARESRSTRRHKWRPVAKWQPYISRMPKPALPADVEAEIVAGLVALVAGLRVTL